MEAVARGKDVSPLVSFWRVRLETMQSVLHFKKINYLSSKAAIDSAGPRRECSAPGRILTTLDSPLPAVV